MLICLDAGHGKDVAGKKSFDESFFEYEFNRDVVRQITIHLLRHGIYVLPTCLSDQDVPLNTRCKISNDAKVDIFVSLHANAYGEDWNTANGYSIFHHTGSTKGKKLAEAIHSESVPFLGLRDRGIKSENFQVLRETDAPAVLVEHFFFTNKEELAKCNTSEFREKCAIADAKGILKYLGVEWIDKVIEPYYKALYENTLSQVDTYRLLCEKIQDKLDQISEIIER
jgi:N-acetylmuramoyl-L-alanine amidase